MNKIWLKYLKLILIKWPEYYVLSYGVYPKFELSKQFLKRTHIYGYKPNVMKIGLLVWAGKALHRRTHARHHAQNCYFQLRCRYLTYLQKIYIDFFINRYVRIPTHIEISQTQIEYAKTQIPYIWCFEKIKLWRTIMFI